jgi:hypothetical protein
MPRRSTKVDPVGTELIPRTIKLLPCLACSRHERAVEEIAQTFWLACILSRRPDRIISGRSDSCPGASGPGDRSGKFGRVTARAPFRVIGPALDRFSLCAICGQGGADV